MRYQITAESRIQKARTALLLDHPFFGALLFRLGGVECQSIATMATDGVSLFYNPAFVDTLNAATLAGVLAHEVMHPALHHHVRRSGRDPGRWNEACDYAINPLLIEQGLSLPEGVLLDARFRGKSAEQIYNLLQKQAEEEKERDQANSTQGTSPKQSTSADNGHASSVPESAGGIGQVIDAPSQVKSVPSPENQSRDWSVAVSQAVTLAKQAGKAPTGIARALEGGVQTTTDWRELLRRLWSEITPCDYSWTRPNRRHIWTGLYLPGTVKEGVGEIAVAVDCSGSVNARQLSLFEAEIGSILEAQRPERVHILYFDTAVHKAECYGAGQPINLTPVGGGGTDFSPCFGWLEEHGIKPQALIFLTDLYSSFPVRPPAYPVLWASTGLKQAPFGSVIPLDAA